MKKVIDEQFLTQIELFQLSVKDNVAGLFGGNHKSKKFGSSCEFSDYREYIEGDDITKIDWNIYLRFEKMYLKLFLDERQMHTRIYIDTSTSMGFHGKDELAMKLATALSYLSVKEMDKVSLYAVRGDYCKPILEKCCGKDAFLNAVSGINDIDFEGEALLSDAIMRSTVGYGDGRSIIISDFLTDTNFFDAIDYLRGKKRDVMCIQLLSKEEMNPTSRGRTIVHDSENDDRIYKNTISRAVLDAYQTAIKYISKRIEDYCIGREADYIFADTTENLKDIILGKMIKRSIVK